MSQPYPSGSVVELTRRRPAPVSDIQADFFDLLATGDIDQASEIFAVDGQLDFPGLRPVRGRPLIRRMLGIIRRRFDDIAWTLHRPSIGSDGWIAISWQVSGTFRDTGLHYANEGLSLVRLDEDGRVAMLSDYFKDTMAFQLPLKVANQGVASHHV